MDKPAPKPGAGFFARLSGIEIVAPDGPADPRSRVIAEAALRGLRGEGGRKAVCGPRIAADRRKYIGDPWAYFRDILGITLVPQQEEALQMIESFSRVLIPSANNVGKTYLLGGYGVYYLDVVGSTPDPESGEEMGARVLLPGPDHPTILRTVYSKMMVMAERAESKGHKMPGERSIKSVTWQVKAEWEVEAFSPPKKVTQEVAHTASGRHHINMVALIEEGQGVAEDVWRGAEGMCSTDGNKIVSSFNPTEPSGPAYERARTDYHVLHLDAFDHPNVRRRSVVVPGAIGFKVIDHRVGKCSDRGPYPLNVPDIEHDDFLYALPPPFAGWEEKGARDDSIPGHPDADVHVWRPTSIFQAQVRGQWPKSFDGGLFSPAKIDASMKRWREGRSPAEVPDRLGVDCAREGDDDTMFCPAWGESGDSLIRKYHNLEMGNQLRAIDEMLANQRIRVGEIHTAPKGKGPPVVEAILRVFPDQCPWNVDEGGVGASVLDHALLVLRLHGVTGVSFAASAPPRLPGEYLCDNTRAALYCRASMLIDRGLVDIPDDPILRSELLAHSLVSSTRVVEEIVNGSVIKERKPSVLILEKPQVKKKIGRSPDRADALVLALWADPPPKKKTMWFGGGDGAPWHED